MLEPIVMGDPKYDRSGDLKRALDFSIGSNMEGNSFRAAHLQNSPPIAVEEMKRLRSSVADTSVKATGRAKRMDQHLNKLNNYCEAMPSKKQQQRNDVLKNGRFLIHQNPLVPGSQKFDDRPKSVVLNRRTRTSMAEARIECSNNGILWQPLVVSKEQDMIKDKNADSDTVHDKTMRVAAVGEGWEKKIKRKRSVGAVFSRSLDNDEEPKRNVHHNLSIEPTLQSSDLAHGFRSGDSGRSNNKSYPLPSPAGSTARLSLKNEQEKSVLSQNLSVIPIKEGPLGEVTVKLNNLQDYRVMGFNSVVKGKASRASRSGSIAAVNSAANVPRLPGTLEIWEQDSVNIMPSIDGVINRKRTVLAGSSAPSLTQWGGHRPKKISRTRRTNVIPVSNHDETHIQSEGCSPCDFESRISIVGNNASIVSKGAANVNRNFKVEHENVSSPSRLSGSEEYGDADSSRLNHKGLINSVLEDKIVDASQNVGLSAIPIKKNNIMFKEETGDGVRRQGRSGRVLPLPRPIISPPKEKWDNVVPAKPCQNAWSGPDKIESKSGGALEKLSDHNRFAVVGNVANVGSANCSGESDDREELLTAANLACRSSFDACKSPFWKTVDALFTSINADEKLFLAEQIKLAEDSCSSLARNCSHDNTVQVKLDDCCNKKMSVSDSTSCRGNGSMKNKTELKDSLDIMNNVEQLQFSSSNGFLDAEKRSDSVPPLYQRLLSAMIIENENEESEGIGNVFPRSSVDDPSFGSENNLMDRLELRQPVFGVRTRRNGNAHKIFPCNGNTDINEIPSPQARVCNGKLMQRDGSYVRSEVINIEEKLIVELANVGLFSEAVPALDDKEDEFFNMELAKLQRGLREQIGIKKKCLDKIDKAAQGECIKRDLEQVAMDKLVEVAYKKFLATKGSFASKHGIAKVSKQAALAFSKRTLARCRKFEYSGASCFSEPAIREFVYAAPPRFAETELLSCVNLAVVNDGKSGDVFGTSTHPSNQHVITKNLPMSNRGKKKEALLDDVSGGAGFSASFGVGFFGSAKGKRSDRDKNVGRLSVSCSKDDSKSKSRLKQKTTAQLPMSQNAFTNIGELSNNGGNRETDFGLMSYSNATLVSRKERNESVDFDKSPLDDIDSIEKVLGVDSEIGAPHDINSWLNFEMDGLQDHDDGIGLEIPNDDLSELDIF